MQKTIKQSYKVNISITTNNSSDEVVRDTKL